MGKLYIVRPEGTLVLPDTLPVRRGPVYCPKCGANICTGGKHGDGVCMIPWRGCGHCVEGIEDMMTEPTPEGWTSEQGGDGDG